MRWIDLHAHSTASDGTYTPSELVSYATKKGLRALALTDHDTVSGIEEARKTAKQFDIELIPGIELSADNRGSEIHILGLYIDYKNPEFLSKITEFQEGRIQRNQKMLDALAEEGMDVTEAEMLEEFPGAVLTRAHVAKMLVKKGYIKTYEEAFQKYIGSGCRCYVPRKKISPKEAISFIQAANGIPVLAHPLLYHLDMRELDELVCYLEKAGLKGIEALYSLHTEADTRMLVKLAKKYRLLITGGADFHGATKPYIDLGVGKGNLRVPETLLKPLKELL